jgi:hypothetical protein
MASRLPSADHRDVESTVGAVCRLVFHADLTPHHPHPAVWPGVLNTAAQSAWPETSLRVRVGKPTFEPSRCERCARARTCTTPRRPPSAKRFRGSLEFRVSLRVSFVRCRHPRAADVGENRRTLRDVTRGHSLTARATSLPSSQSDPGTPTRPSARGARKYSKTSSVDRAMSTAFSTTATPRVCVFTGCHLRWRARSARFLTASRGPCPTSGGSRFVIASAASFARSPAASRTGPSVSLGQVRSRLRLVRKTP